MIPLNVTYSTVTSRGERAVNEDSIGVLEESELRAFVLCDGLGGHGNGDKASRFVVNRMKADIKKHMSLEKCIEDAQEGLMQKQRQENAVGSMKTTLTCLVITGGVARLGYVGDSRIYCFENGKFRFRTLDHSVPQMLATRGEIKEKDIRHHEDRSRLLRVMGSQWDSPRYEILDGLRLKSKMAFLLCSDGFWELIEEKDMIRLLKQSKTPDEWIAQMAAYIEVTGRGTNMDNYSAIAVFVK